MTEDARHVIELAESRDGVRDPNEAVLLDPLTDERDRIGTRVEVVAGDLRQAREVRSTYGYMSANDLRLLIGLGSHAAADSVTLRWPAGTVQVLTDVATDQLLTVVEDTAAVR